MPLPRAIAAPAVLLGALAAPAAAQKDYRNLDDDRPVHTEDAFPIDRRALELMLPAAGSLRSGAVPGVFALPELMWGAVANGHLTLKLPVRLTATGDASPALSAPELTTVYLLTDERPGLPAIGVRADLHLPVGGPAGGTMPAAQLKMMATRAFGATRAHLNASWAWVSDSAVRRSATPPARTSVSLALDRTLWRHALLLVGDLVWEREAGPGRPEHWTAHAGVRWQWTPVDVLDAGIARRLGAVGPDVALTLGFTRMFAVGTKRRPPQPEAR